MTAEFKPTLNPPFQTDWTLGPGEAAHLLHIEQSVCNRLNQPSPHPPTHPHTHPHTPTHTLREISCMVAQYTFCCVSSYSLNLGNKLAPTPPPPWLLVMGETSQKPLGGVPCAVLPDWAGFPTPIWQYQCCQIGWETSPKLAALVASRRYGHCYS